MAASFPTALQRTSDERWVTLQVVAREDRRALARMPEAPDQTAVVRTDADAHYDRHLRDLLSTPPPAPGPGVHLAWPVDLLHDLDCAVVGYTARRAGFGSTFPLAEFVAPTSRARIAPMAGRRHLLRVARNVATATAAVHHAGHGRVRGRHYRLDDHARVVLVRADELLSRTTAAQRADDERRLGFLVVRLLGGTPWASDGDLAGLIRRAGRPDSPAVPAQEWFFALREAERALPATTRLTRPVQATRIATPADLASDDPAAVSQPAVAAVPDMAPAPVSTAAMGPVTVAPRRDEGTARVPSPTRQPMRRQAAHVDGRHTAAAVRGRTRPDRRADAPARPAFAIATGLMVGGLASVAPFAAFLAVATAMVMRAALDVGRRKSTLGPAQTAAITASRLLPFATGGLALATFILLDLLLVLGLLMALAERLFDYGPGFTLTWILQLPEVPGLVRAFAFALGAFAGLTLGGPAYDRIRAGAQGRRLIATPAIALALALGILIADVSIVWWPLPLLT